jgi:hypothetical protein
VFSHDAKASILHSFFKQLLGTPSLRRISLTLTCWSLPLDSTLHKLLPLFNLSPCLRLERLFSP